MRSMRALIVGYLVILLLTGWPVLVAGAAALVASSNGCTLNEARAHPCVVWGVDHGSTLYSLAMMPWLLIALIPLGTVAGLGWTTAWLVWRIAMKRRRDAPE